MTVRFEVTGTNRTGDPLLTADQAVRDTIVQIAYNAWRLTGYPTAPIGQALADRIHHPQPGDLVYIPDSRRRDNDTRLKGFGYLVSTRTEWLHDDAIWAEISWQYDGEPRPTDDVFYIQYDAGADFLCRWTNASCHAIPYGDTLCADVTAAANRIVEHAGAPTP